MTDDEDHAMEIAYLALGRLIAGECPAGFEAASLHMEIDGDRAKLSITALLPDGTRLQLQPGASAQDILECLRGIRKAGARADGALWSSCVVTLKAGGGFAMDVEY